MIQKNELRVGNILIHPLKDNQVFVIKSGADIDEIYTMQELKGYYLTPELLKKCGFEYTASFGECRYTKGELQMDENFNPLVQDGDEYLYYGKRVEFLHELQNLYFALTGEELPIRFSTGQSK